MKRHILMLEHDDDDRYITQAALDDLKADVTISFVCTSTEFFQKLEGPSKPDLVLITYRASPLNAVDILRKLKTSVPLRHIPAIILSGMANPAIVRECYEAGAVSFITKPSSEKGTANKISSFLKYWFETVEMP
jgi:CheY-like chemotaxis protein